jgi:dihydroflavonol-4-reductase
MNGTNSLSEARRVFVTGGNGFVGSSVVRALAARGDHVLCLLRETSDTRRLDGLAVERITGDIRDGVGLRAAMSGCDRVIHLACLSSWDQIDSPQMDAVAVEGTRNVLNAALANGCRRVVYVSSALAVGASRKPVPLNEESEGEVSLTHLRYSSAKRKAEQLCLEAAGLGLPVVIVNPGEVYGPRDHAMVTAGNLVDFARSWPVLVCDGGICVSHVDDIAAGIVAALDRGVPGERYILAGENLSVRQLATLTLEILGRRRPVLGFPNPLVKMLAWMGNNLHLPLPFSPAIVPYATLYWFMDSGKARRELGVSFRGARETLDSTLGWLRESGRLQ